MTYPMVYLMLHTPSPCGQTDVCENITGPKLRLRAVIIFSISCNLIRFNRVGIFFSHITKTAQFQHPCSPIGLSPQTPMQQSALPSSIEYRSSDYRQQENLVPANPFLNTSMATIPSQSIFQGNIEKIKE